MLRKLLRFEHTDVLAEVAKLPPVASLDCIKSPARASAVSVHYLKRIINIIMHIETFMYLFVYCFRLNLFAFRIVWFYLHEIKSSEILSFKILSDL